MEQIIVTDTEEGVHGIWNLTAKESREEPLHTSMMLEKDGTKNIEDSVGILDSMLGENQLPGIECLITNFQGDDMYSG